MEMVIPAYAPFDLASVVGSHGWIRLAPFDSDENLSSLRYVDQLGTGKVVALQIQAVKDGVSVHIDDDLIREERAEIHRKVIWMLGLDQDLTPFYKMALNEPKLASVVERVRGRILRSATLFEDTVKTILTTNTAWGGTIRMNNTLVKSFGAQLPSNPEERAFPSPETIALSDEETLRSTVRLGYRSPYVLDLARTISNGELDLEALKDSQIPTIELRKSLLNIKGVGGYAAANLLMILGRYDYLPIDSWALKVVSNEFYNGEPIGPLEVETSFERWGEWKGLAYWFWDWSSF